VALNYYNATNSVSHSTRSWEAAAWGYQQLRVLHGRGFSSCRRQRGQWWSNMMTMIHENRNDDNEYEITAHLDLDLCQLTTHEHSYRDRCW